MTTSTRRPSGIRSSKPGVGQGRAGGVEDEELLGLAPLDGPGHDPVRGRVERDRRRRGSRRDGRRRGRGSRESGSKKTAGSQRSAGTSPIASRPARMFSQKANRSPAPGNRQAMPTIAMSSGRARRLIAPPPPAAVARAAAARRASPSSPATITSTSPLRPNRSSSASAAQPSSGRDHPQAAAAEVPFEVGDHPDARPRAPDHRDDPARPAAVEPDRQLVQGLVGRRVVGLAPVAEPAGDRREERGEPERLGPEQPGEVQGAVELGAEHAVERLGRLVAEQLVLDHPRAVDQADGVAEPAAPVVRGRGPRASASRTSARAYSTVEPGRAERAEVRADLPLVAGASDRPAPGRPGRRRAPRGGAGRGAPAFSSAGVDEPGGRRVFRLRRAAGSCRRSRSVGRQRRASSAATAAVIPRAPPVIEDRLARARARARRPRSIERRRHGAEPDAAGRAIADLGPAVVGEDLVDEPRGEDLDGLAPGRGRRPGRGRSGHSRASVLTRPAMPPWPGRSRPGGVPDEANAPPIAVAATRQAPPPRGAARSRSAAAARASRNSPSPPARSAPTRPRGRARRPARRGAAGRGRSPRAARTRGPRSSSASTADGRRRDRPDPARRARPDGPGLAQRLGQRRGRRPGRRR